LDFRGPAQGRVLGQSGPQWPEPWLGWKRGVDTEDMHGSKKYVMSELISSRTARRQNVQTLSSIRFSLQSPSAHQGKGYSEAMPGAYFQGPRYRHIFEDQDHKH